MADPQAGAAFAATWDAFCGAACMQGPTPGHREAWAAGRSTYAVWAIRVESEALHDRVCWSLAPPSVASCGRPSCCDVGKTAAPNDRVRRIFARPPDSGGARGPT